MQKIMFLHGCYLALGSRSKVKVKVKGRGQGQRSRSKVGVKVKFLAVKFPAVDNRGSALPSAAKSNKSHYQFKVFVCVSVISGHMRIIASMRSIGVLILRGTSQNNFLAKHNIPSYSPAEYTTPCHVKGKSTFHDQSMSRG